MKRWLTKIGIAIYLGGLVFGFFAHAFEVGHACHPIMYFFVWDMFCGWSGYEARMHVIGEGESGKFYELAPGPWGEFHPYGFISRQHYDPEFRNGERMAHNTLKHTVHEPMVRLFVIEEEYPKKFNLPDDQYVAYFNKPKVYHSYFHTRFVLSPEGEILKQQPVWLRYEAQVSLEDNPRMLADVKRHHSFFATDSGRVTRGALSSGPFFEPPSLVRVASPLAE